MIKEVDINQGSPYDFKSFTGFGFFDHLIFEQTILDLVGQFTDCPVIDVAIKQYTVHLPTVSFFGSGFLHFPFTAKGVASARLICASMRNALIQDVYYDFKIALSLPALIADRPDLDVPTPRGEEGEEIQVDLENVQMAYASFEDMKHLIPPGVTEQCQSGGYHERSPKGGMDRRNSPPQREFVGHHQHHQQRPSSFRATSPLSAAGTSPPEYFGSHYPVQYTQQQQQHSQEAQGHGNGRDWQEQQDYSNQTVQQAQQQPQQGYYPPQNMYPGQMMPQMPGAPQQQGMYGNPAPGGFPPQQQQMQQYPGQMMGMPPQQMQQQGVYGMQSQHQHHYSGYSKPQGHANQFAANANAIATATYQNQQNQQGRFAQQFMLPPSQPQQQQQRAVSLSAAYGPLMTPETGSVGHAYPPRLTSSASFPPHGYSAVYAVSPPMATSGTTQQQPSHYQQYQPVPFPIQIPFAGTSSHPHVVSPVPMYADRQMVSVSPPPAQQQRQYDNWKYRGAESNRADNLSAPVATRRAAAAMVSALSGREGQSRDIEGSGVDEVSASVANLNGVVVVVVSAEWIVYAVSRHTLIECTIGPCSGVERRRDSAMHEQHARIGWHGQKSVASDGSDSNGDEKKELLSVELFFSFRSSKVRNLVCEETIRDLIAEVTDCPVVDIAFKTYILNTSTPLCFGSGFLHLPVTAEGVKAARLLSNALHNINVEDVGYDFKIAHSLSDVFIVRPDLRDEEAEALNGGASTRPDKLCQTTKQLTYATLDEMRHLVEPNLRHKSRGDVTSRDSRSNERSSNAHAPPHFDPVFTQHPSRFNGQHPHYAHSEGNVPSNIHAYSHQARHQHQNLTLQLPPPAAAAAAAVSRVHQVTPPAACHVVSPIDQLTEHQLGRYHEYPHGSIIRQWSNNKEDEEQQEECRRKPPPRPLTLSPRPFGAHAYYQPQEMQQQHQAACQMMPIIHQQQQQYLAAQMQMQYHGGHGAVNYHQQHPSHQQQQPATYFNYLVHFPQQYAPPVVEQQQQWPSHHPSTAHARQVLTVQHPFQHQQRQQQQLVSGGGGGGNNNSHYFHNNNHSSQHQFPPHTHAPQAHTRPAHHVYHMPPGGGLSGGGSQHALLATTDGGGHQSQTPHDGEHRSRVRYNNLRYNNA
eukprot:gene24400-30744_t